MVRFWGPDSYSIQQRLLTCDRRIQYSPLLDLLDIEGSNVIGMTGMVRGKDSKAEELSDCE